WLRFGEIMRGSLRASLAVLARHTVADSLAELERGDKRACAEYAAEQEAEAAGK
ncbi:TPA: Rrf2 family transcriptional regulator, partial [Serratia marcescens]|nr:Rrf2 family transcriptional regulator [Serratia marcescens]